MKKRLVFKKWVNDLVAMLFISSFVLLLSIDDFESIVGMIVVYGMLILTLLVTGGLLNEFGRKN